MPIDEQTQQTTPQGQPQAQTVSDPAQDILSKTQTDDKSRADAWEIYHNHEGKEFESKLAATSLPQETKAALWNAKTAASGSVYAGSKAGQITPPAEPQPNREMNTVTTPQNFLSDRVNAFKKSYNEDESTGAHIAKTVIEQGEGLAKNLAQISAPGIVTSILNKKAPSVAAHIPGHEYATPAAQLPGQIVQNYALGGGLEGLPGTTGEPEPAPAPVPEPVAPRPDTLTEESNVNALKKDLDLKQKNYDEAKAKDDQHVASHAEGVLSPAPITKALAKAEAELKEAQYHHRTAVNAVEKARAAKATPAPAPQPEVPAEQIEAMPRPGAPKPAAAPENVKTPGPVQPEVVPQPLLEQPRTPIGRMQLPDEQGTMGKPRQLTAGANPPTGTSNLEDVVKATEEKQKPGMPQIKQPEEAPKPATDEAALRALEAKEGKVVTNPKKLVGEQPKEALKPGEAPKAIEPAAPKAKEATEAPAENPAGTHDEKGVRKEPENVRKPGEELSPEAQAVQHKALESVSSLSNDNLDKLAREMGIDASDPIYSRAKEMRGEGREQTGRIRQANAILERMNSEEILKAAAKADQVNGDAASANWARAKRAAAVFEERLSGAPEEGGFGAKNKLVSKEEADAALKRFNDKATRSNAGIDPTMLADAAKVAAYYIEAGARSFAEFSEEMVKRLGEDIRPHLQALYEQANGKSALEAATEETTRKGTQTPLEVAAEKTEKQTPLEAAVEKTEYKGEERREAERPATMSPTEIEDAMKNRKPVHTPFDVTEGANETIKRDTAMPKHPAEEAAAKGTVGTEAAAKSDTEHFANAKKELGDKASIREIADRAQEMKDAAKVKGEFKPVEHDEYAKAVKSNPQAATLTDTDSMKNNKAFSNGKGVYYSISPEGDLQGVINNSGEKGALKEIMPHAIANGAKTLDAWDVYLPKQYEKYGFERTKSVPYDVKNYGEPPQELKDAWKAQGWKEGDPNPSVQYMKLKEGVTGEGPAKEGFPDKIDRPTTKGKAMPTGDALIKKYGVSNGDPKDTTFILDDGRAVANSGTDHDLMLGGKATDKNPPRERFVAEGNIRVRPHMGTSGRETSFSIPESGVNAAQLAVIQKMSPQLRTGAVMIEVGKPGGKYEAIPYGEATNERIEQAIQNVTGKAVKGNTEPPRSVGGAAAGAALAKEPPTNLGTIPGTDKNFAEHLNPKDKGTLRSNVSRKNFVENAAKLPALQEYIDSAQQGAGERKWYQRGDQAFTALVASAKDTDVAKYFQEGDREKFANFVAALSPQQSVKMDLQEALHAWTKAKDMIDDGATDAQLSKMLHQELTMSTGKVPNAMKALKGEPMWDDLRTKGFKAPSFGDNLNGFLDRVTTDGWHAVWNGIKNAGDLSKASVYHPISAMTRAAAEHLGWEPAEAQAAIWAVVKTLTEKGTVDQADIRQYSSDFADLMQYDKDIRDQLTEMGFNVNELDKQLAKHVEAKPEVASGISPSGKDSLRKLVKRVQGLRPDALSEAKIKAVNDYIDQQSEPEGTGSEPNEKVGTTDFNPDETVAGKLAKLGKKKPGFKKM